MTKHGTYNSYTNGKCRCEECRKAASDYMRKYRSTDRGRKTQRYYTILGNKKAQLASQWIQENRPDIWEMIGRKATKLIGEKPQKTAGDK